MYKWIALTSGFCLMAFELVAARLLAPTIGSSTFIWTNVIGVIMAALAFGYWWGGKLADQRKKDTDIIYLCLLVAILATIVLLFHPAIIDLAVSIFSDARWQGLLAALLLFAPTSIVLGMLSPYLAKLALKTTAETGKTVARLSTFNAIGSIVGTFVTGFFLFGIIGSRATLAVVIVGMLIASWLIQPTTLLKRKIIVSLVLLLIVIFAITPAEYNTINIDTATSHYRITKTIASGRPVTYLWAGPNGIQSAMLDTGDKELIFWYTREIASIVAHHADQTVPPSRILIIGGGAFTLPEYFGNLYEDAEIDVVEIDPELENIARKYFRFEKPSNVTVYAEDARSYINRTKDKTYDFIVIDVFSDASIPWQFLTAEFGDKVTELLSDRGIVIINFISSDTSGCTKFFEAQIATYNRHLPFAFVKSQAQNSQSLTNRELVFARSNLSLPEGYELIDSTGFRYYTDDFAPIEHLWQDCLNTTTPRSN